LDQLHEPGLGSSGVGGGLIGQKNRRPMTPMFASRTKWHLIRRRSAGSGSDAPLLRRVMAHSRLYNDRMHANSLRRGSLLAPVSSYPCSDSVAECRRSRVSTNLPDELSSPTACSECGHPQRRHVVLPNPELARWLRLIHGGCPNCAACADE
jgi:hypothetical protein